MFTKTRIYGIIHIEDKKKHNLQVERRVIQGGKSIWNLKQTRKEIGI